MKLTKVDWRNIESERVNVRYPELEVAVVKLKFILISVTPLISINIHQDFRTLKRLLQPFINRRGIKYCSSLNLPLSSIP